MAACENCGVLGWTVPLFARPIMIAHQPGYLIICGTCKSLADAALVRKIEMWEAPFGGTQEREELMRGTRAKAMRAQAYQFRDWPISARPRSWGMRFVDALGVEHVTVDTVARAYRWLKRLRRGMSPDEARRSA